MFDGIAREGMRRFKTRRVESVFRLKQVELPVDESFDLRLPMAAECFRLFSHAGSLQIGNQINNHQFVVESCSVCRPAFDLHGNGEQRDRSPISPAQILDRGQSSLNLRIVFRHAIHAVVEQDDVRVIIDPPQVALAVASRVETLAIRLPVGDAVDGVRKRLFPRLLQPAPDKILEVVIERLNLSLHWELGVLGGKVGGLAESGIVTGDGIDAPTLDAIIVVRT